MKKYYYKTSDGKGLAELDFKLDAKVLEEEGLVETTEEDFNNLKPQPKAVNSTKVRISELKSNLAKTDYEAIKFAEGEMSAEDYEPYKVQRRAWRAEINQLEEELK